MRMNHKRIAILILLFIPVFLMILDSRLSAFEDVRHTKHNLIANPDIQAMEGAAGRQQPVGTDGATLFLNQEVCIFCHTPHAGLADVKGAVGAAPLWNRRLPTDTAFIPYSSQNFDAQDSLGTPGRPKGVSLACLSCHDGAVAFDALINATGSGGFSQNNKLTTGPGGSIGLSFGGLAVDGSNSFKEGQRAPGPPGGFVFFDAFGFGPNGSAGTEPFPNLGLDLRDDHPVGMEIPTTDPQFSQIMGNLFLLDGGGTGHTPGSNKVFWITRTGFLQPDKRDRVRAYPSNPNRLDAPYIECASCHNPHEASRPKDANHPGGQPALTDPINVVTVNNSLFLRAPSFPDPGTFPNSLLQDRNQGSLLCLSCHKK
jgi:hypothetical protein